MNFLDHLVVPQSGNTLHLLHFLLMLANMIFLIYAGILSGSYFLSVWFNYSAERNHSPIHARLSRDYIDLITSSKMMGFGLGFVPFSAIIFLYSELLHTSGAPVTPYFIFSFILFFISLLFVYVFKHSLHLKSIFSYVENKIDLDEKNEATEGLNTYRKNSSDLNSKTGIVGLLIMAFSIEVFIAAQTLSVDKAAWEGITNIFDLMLYGAAIIKIIHFVTAAFAMTGVAYLIKLFFWDKHSYALPEEYSAFSKRFNIGLALLFTIVQPLFLVLNLVITPKDAISSYMFGITVVVIILAFVAAHMFYAMYQGREFKLMNLAFYFVLVVFSFIIIKEQAAFAISNKQLVANLDAEYEVFEADMIAAFRGAEEEVINGEEIYKSRCTACHAFDTKLVGPPHKSVLSKYINDKDALVKFILNPVKINPEYPAMANQGLSPKEAKAVADYMIEHYGPELE